MTRQRPFFSSVLGYSSAVLTIAALAFYCVARIAYSLYYGHYGVSPESVGITFQGLLVQEASALNVALLVVVAAIFLRAGWLINNAELGTNQIQRQIDAASAERDMLIRSIEANATTDTNAQRRNLIRVESVIRDLEAEQTVAAQSDRHTARQGRRWFAAGLLIFALWGTGIITEAAVTSAGPRVGAWFDPLQIDVLSVTGLSTSAESGNPPADKDAQGASLLFLGSDSSHDLLYDPATKNVWLLPETSSRLDLR
jgi:hypothetical protein